MSSLAFRRVCHLHFPVHFSLSSHKIASANVRCKIYADDVKIYRKLRMSRDADLLKNAVDNIVVRSDEYVTLKA